MQYHWNFGDGTRRVTTAKEAAILNHTYPNEGTFTATLTVTDRCGATSPVQTVTIRVAPVTNQAPTVNAGNDQTITLPATATLNGSATDDGLTQALTINWTKTLGPGTVTFANSTSAVTTASFSTAGTYTLRLSAYDGQWTTPDDVVVTVNASGGCTGNCVPVANAGLDHTVQAGTAILFDASASRDTDGTIKDYFWAFGDGFSTNWITTPTVSHTYATPGTYTVRLWVRDNLNAQSPEDNSISTITSPACTNNVLPTASIGLTPTPPVILGTSLTFNAQLSSDSDGTIKSWAWDFGDGFIGQGSLIQHIYTKVGTYTARLTVTDNCGGTRSRTETIQINPAQSSEINPKLLGWVTGAFGTVQGVSTSPDGRTLYVASAEFGVVEFDVTNPATPIWRRSAKDFRSLVNSELIGIDGDDIVVTGINRVAMVGKLSTLGTTNESWRQLGFSGQGLVVKNGKAYVAAGPAGFKIVDLKSADLTTKTVPMTFVLFA